jgi:hypothetical protein
MVGMSGTAIFAHTTTLYERNYYSGPRLDRLHILPNFFDNARKLMAENSWQPKLPAYPLPVSLPQMPI